MRKLWQWHRVTAVNDSEILAIARAHALDVFDGALARVAAGPTVIETVDDAIDYIERQEIGSVAEYDVIEVCGVTMEIPADKPYHK